MNWKRIAIAVFSATYLILAASLFRFFLRFHEARVAEDGIPFSDPFMDLLPVGDVSLPLFTVTYGSIILYILIQRKQPYAIEKGFIAYGTLVLLRIATMSAFPLRPPSDLVYLEDPFLNNMIYPGNIESDLFFSGHVGLVFLFFFLSRKWIFLLLGVLVALLVMVQRVHFSIDVLGAVPFAYVIVWVVKRFIFPDKNATLLKGQE